MANPVNPRFIQAQSFQLSAAGATAGSTSITLQSFLYSDGITQIVTADLGDWCYMTLEPNNGTQEEAIQFTGVTQNANGTATLTGVSSVGFKYPYTLTSGLVLNHAGGVTCIISNDAAMYGNLVAYMNSTLASGLSPIASTTVKGVVQIPTATQINSSLATGSAGAPLAITPDQLLLSSYGVNNSYVTNVADVTSIPYTFGGGTSTAFTATLASSTSTLASGTFINFQIPTTNASGVTLNVNSLGAKPITKNYNVSLASGDVVTGQIASVVYDGANFQLVSPYSAITSGQTTHDISTTTTTTIAHGLGISPRFIRIEGYFLQTSAHQISHATTVYSLGVQSSIYYYFITNATTNQGVGTTFTFQDSYDTGSLTGAVTADQTNIYITWTKSGTTVGTANLLWHANT